ncbi:MAG: prophage regulatory protein [Cellvibrionaceae bacterium]|jgi:prophage regulatory protein
MSFTTLQHDDPILRYSDVIHQTGLSKNTIRRMVGEGNFPSPISLSKRSVGFLSSQVTAWKEQRITDSRKSKEAS